MWAPDDEVAFYLRSLQHSKSMSLRGAYFRIQQLAKHCNNNEIPPTHRMTKFKKRKEEHGRASLFEKLTSHTMAVSALTPICRPKIRCMPNSDVFAIRSQTLIDHLTTCAPQTLLIIKRHRYRDEMRSNVPSMRPNKRDLDILTTCHRHQVLDTRQLRVH